MYINFFKNIYTILLENGFRILKSSYVDTINEENSENPVFLYKETGATLIITGIVNIDKCSKENYIQIANKLLNSLEYFENDGNESYSALPNGAVFLVSYLAGYEHNSSLLDTIDNEDFSTGKNLYKLYYLVNLETKEISVPNNQIDIQDSSKYAKKAILSNMDSLLYGVNLGEVQSHIYEKTKLSEKSNTITLTLLLVTTNIIIYFFLQFFNYGIYFQETLLNGAINRYAVLNGGEYYRLISAIFLHVNYMHLAGNMLGLYIYGSRVEKILGKSAFLIVYFFSGIVGSIASCIVTENSVGASGAIFGLLGSVAAISFKTRKTIHGLSPYVIAILSISAILSGFMLESINNYAHFGGFAAGFFISFLFIDTNQTV